MCRSWPICLSILLVALGVSTLRANEASQISFAEALDAADQSSTYPGQDRSVVETALTSDVLALAPIAEGTFIEDAAVQPCLCKSCQTPGNACGACNCGCQKKKPAPAKPNPCATSHKGVFYANDFSYLSDPKYKGCCFGDGLKLMPLGNCGQLGTLDIGGQLRFRYHHERGMGQETGLNRFQATDTDFLLTRARLYTNWKMNDWLRFYSEGIVAEASAEAQYVPRAIDRNYGDFLNAFFDVKMTDDWTVRVGRQELLFGSQRLISPLDWANTRRTFEGIRTTVKAGDWTADGFWTAFVPVNPSDLDTADWKQQFYGVYATYAGLKNVNLDTYYIGYDDRRAGPNADFSLHTLGARLWGTTQNDWLWEVEGGPQFGRQSGLGLDHDAGFCTVGMGRKLADMPWSPTLWFYYDYASGNHGAGDFNRFNHLFPLAHKYLGFIDAVQRSNIQSPNVLLTMQPTKKLGLLCWYYHFQADSATDIVPSVGGTPTQNNVKDFGDELDILATINLNARTEVWIGWSHLWRGDKIVGTNDADFFYSQWQLNF